MYIMLNYVSGLLLSSLLLLALPVRRSLIDATPDAPPLNPLISLGCARFPPKSDCIFAADMMRLLNKRVNPNLLNQKVFIG